MYMSQFRFISLQKPCMLCALEIWGLYLHMLATSAIVDKSALPRLEQIMLSAVALELCIMHLQRQHYNVTFVSVCLKTTEFDV